MKCLILAGGFGLRLHALGIKQAKALLPYKGKPLLTHIVDSIPENIDILLTTNSKFKADFLEWQRTANRKVEILIEPALTNEQKLGSVSSLNFWIGKKNIKEDLLVICGDNYFELNLRQFVGFHNGKSALIGAYDIGDKSKARQLGVVKLQGDKVIEFQEKPAMPKTSLISTGIYIFSPGVFPYLSKYCSQGRRDQMGEFICYLLDVYEVRAYTFTSLWFDVGTGNLHWQKEQTIGDAH